MIQSKTIFRSTILLFGCFLALNLHMVYGQDEQSEVKPVCPTETSVKAPTSN